MAHIFKAKYRKYPFELTKVFKKWYQNGTHVDVTIHVDGQSIAAHKLVLAANSPFFNGVFLDANARSHLYFEDVPFESMKSLIEYMYSGDLIVGHKFLPACLMLADSLGVRGISGISMDGTLTEPATVSENMHNLIEVLMKQNPTQKQPKVRKQTREKPLNRNQEKKPKAKIKNKSIKRLGRIRGLSEKGVSHVPSKSVKKLKNTNGYELEQFGCNKPDNKKTETGEKISINVSLQQENRNEDEKTVAIEENISIIESPKQTNKNEDEKTAASEENISIIESPQQTNIVPYTNSNPITSPEVARDATPNINAEDNNKVENLFSEEKLCEQKNDELVVTTKNVTLDPANCKQEYTEKIRDIVVYSPGPSNTRFQNEVLDGNMNESSERIQPIKDYIGPKMNLTLNEINREDSETALKKNEKIEKIEKIIEKKEKIKKPKIISQNQLDEEFERLFGDNYFGLIDKDKVKINNSSPPPPPPTPPPAQQNEQIDQKPLLSSLAEIDYLEDQKAESVKRNGNRRKIPLCPPPEDIWHNGKPSFACGLCKRKYTHKSNYRRHYLVFHMRCAEAVFQCPMCTKKFTRSDNRTHHIRRIHLYSNTASLLSEEQALFLCPICKKAFTRSYNRTFHMVNEHGIKNPLTIEK